MKILLSAILFSFLTSGCTKQQPMPIEPVIDRTTASPNGEGNFTYLALGDSYTIGQSVKQAESFPYQLQSLLKAKSKSVTNPKIIAVTGWTTDELQSAIKKENLTGTYSFVTLLIGVNNQYRGYPINTYKKEFAELLQTAITFAGGDKSKVFVVSIPDWGATPFGRNSGRDPQTIAAEIDSFNAANQEITLAAGVNYTNITPASRKATTDIALVADDGLHPSGKMYAEWAEALSAKVANVLE
ncbi:SGNH/GDSL hydrolase family protein [Pedobacter psychrodurus]|uniref:SGNH/GDSL hydrolase family protein n=1 Tax=Pedobacter psychrodurus TaxID=2530456 RepID=A0A4R0PY30_9SPHI|nr:SGNH/GDSL hydrolase family protein [Pedobacter psychrodurus]TCD27882.1 SGNH/GDSL hydrolase family protein [Pedobacter psychrodurus]